MNPTFVLPAEQLEALGKWVESGVHMADVYVSLDMADGTIRVRQGDSEAFIDMDGMVTE